MSWLGPSLHHCARTTKAPFEEMSQRWRALNNTESNLTGPRFEPQTSHSTDERVTAQLTYQTFFKANNLSKKQTLRRLKNIFTEKASTFIVMLFVRAIHKQRAFFQLTLICSYQGIKHKAKKFQISRSRSMVLAG